MSKQIIEALKEHFDSAKLDSDFGSDNPVEIGDCDLEYFKITSCDTEQLSDDEFRKLKSDPRDCELGMSFETCKITEKETDTTVLLEISNNLHFDENLMPNGESTTNWVNASVIDE